MARAGQDIIDVGSTRAGESYIFGAVVPLANPNWHGPWDCAEFASWCAYQAYDGMIFGAGRVTNPSKAEPYSGHWFTEAKKFGTVIAWQDALHMPGAVLVRSPAAGRIGHVAFALGDGDRTLEARGKAFGVNIFGKAATRPWSIGCLLPGVEYGDAPLPPQVDAPTSLPSGYLWLKRPAIKGGDVVALQRALAAKGIDPGPVDGEFGPLTEAAVLSFQLREGLEVDGVVGPATAASLGLAFPIPASAADTGSLAQAASPSGRSPVVLAPSGAIDGVVGIEKKGQFFQAKTASGFTFVIGSSTSYTDDMRRVGLFQKGAAITDSLKFGVYDAADFAGTFGPWAHFIGPTLAAEGNARFATLNTYDRAAFTFGAPQLAAHTPGENFVVYLRRLLALPGADKHFPELSLRSNEAGESTVHLAVGQDFRDLEEMVSVLRPNGKRDEQLPHLMAYLNSSPTAVDAAELSAAARLMNWLRLDPKAKDLQISVFIDHAQDKLAKAKRKVPAFTGKDWRISLWIMDILHQGRGTYPEIARALDAARPEERLQAIGAGNYKKRIDTVASAVRTLAQSRVLDGFEV